MYLPFLLAVEVRTDKIMIRSLIRGFLLTQPLTVRFHPRQCRRCCPAASCRAASPLPRPPPGSVGLIGFMARFTFLSEETDSAGCLNRAYVGIRIAVLHLKIKVSSPLQGVAESVRTTLDCQIFSPSPLACL